MKKLGALVALALTFAVCGHTQAQRTDPGKMSGSKMSGSKMSGGKMAGHKMGIETKSLTGPVKGAPTGRMFTLGLRKGPLPVDATKATIRVNGKFAKIDAVKPGEMVTVVGKMDGLNFKADTVTVKSMPGGKKVGGAKMAPMKGHMPAGKTKM